MSCRRVDCRGPLVTTVDGLGPALEQLYTEHHPLYHCPWCLVLTTHNKRLMFCQDHDGLSKSDLAADLAYARRAWGDLDLAHQRLTGQMEALLNALGPFVEQVENYAVGDVWSDETARRWDAVLDALPSSEQSEAAR